MKTLSNSQKKVMSIVNELTDINYHTEAMRVVAMWCMVNLNYATYCEYETYFAELDRKTGLTLCECDQRHDKLQEMYTCMELDGQEYFVKRLKGEA